MKNLPALLTNGKSREENFKPTKLPALLGDSKMIVKILEKHEKILCLCKK